ncbi:MAG: hypothetical protein ACTSVU_09270, partial [Promethearchaeota archaeon]
HHSFIDLIKTNSLFQLIKFNINLYWKFPILEIYIFILTFFMACGVFCSASQTGLFLINNGINSSIIEAADYEMELTFIVSSINIITISIFFILILIMRSFSSQSENGNLNLLLSLPIKRRSFPISSFFSIIIITGFLTIGIEGLELIIMPFFPGKFTLWIFVSLSTFLILSVFAAFNLFLSVFCKRSIVSALIAIVTWFGLLFLQSYHILSEKVFSFIFSYQFLIHYEKPQLSSELRQFYNPVQFVIILCVNLIICIGFLFFTTKKFQKYSDF